MSLKRCYIVLYLLSRYFDLLPYSKFSILDIRRGLMIKSFYGTDEIDRECQTTAAQFDFCTYGFLLRIGNGLMYHNPGCTTILANSGKTSSARDN